MAVTLLAPVALVIGLLLPRGRIRPFERLGVWRSAAPCDWWFHGASVGEVAGLLPVINGIKSSAPSTRVLLTVTSPSAISIAESVADEVRLLPFDSPLCITLAMKRVPARHLVISETELWPFLLYTAKHAGLSLSLVNGRISDYTAKRYRMLRFFFVELLQSFSQIFVVGERDAERFTALGALREVVSVVGNTKYDAAPSLVGDDETAALRVRLFPDLAERPDAKIVVLGSVRPSEEEGWISGVKSLLTQGYDIRLVVAPRHAEKFSYFRDKLDTAGLSWRAYSEIVLGNGPVEGLHHAEPLTSRKVVLLDTMGVLKSVYGIADLAFIGATLVDIGGHNPLEASMYGCPVCVGPFTSVVKEICDDLSQEGALVRLTSAEEIEPLLGKFISSPKDFQSMGARGKRVWERYTGATAKIVDALLYPTASDLCCNVNNDDELRK